MAAAEPGLEEEEEEKKNINKGTRDYGQRLVREKEWWLWRLNKMFEVKKYGKSTSTEYTISYSTQRCHIMLNAMCQLFKESKPQTETVFWEHATTYLANQMPALI